ncbi:MAG: hypothetical protein K6E12_00595 [Saccharofermentans sp.]|nr:hypothetical protein [Saccharofermentans sp.]
MSTLVNSFKTPETRKKILFTFLIVSVLCLLTIVPIPGLNHGAASAAVNDWGDMGTVINILSGHALSNVSITSLGIYPFLVASIVMQIVVIAVPKLRNLSQMGEEGTKKITKLTRIASIGASVLFAALYCVGMRNAVTTQINYWLAIVIAGLTVAVGSAFCGWCVELINNKGIGDGLTVIIVASIVRHIPSGFISLFNNSDAVLGRIPAICIAVFGCALFIGAIFLAILFNMGEKKIRIIFSKRTVGMKQYGMQNQVIPLKVTQAGIMPVIYTLVITLLPSAIFAMVVPGTDIAWVEMFKNFFTNVSFIPFFIIFVVFFVYVFSMMQFNPIDMSSQIRENGGYIQGLKPGRPTAQYLLNMFSNLNLADNAYLIIVCVIPLILNFIPGLSGICFAGIGLVLLAGGFIEMKTLLDNALKAEEEKAKAAGKDKKRKNYNKK